MKKNALIYMLLVVLVLAPTGVALANSAPPPAVVWFTLENESNQAPHLRGLQLVGCPSAACEPPVLLQQYGTCEAAGCLPGPVTLSGWRTSFACASNRCYSTAYPNYGGTAFKLVAEFSDRVRQSPVTSTLPSSFGQEAAWTVHVGETELTLTPDSTSPTIDLPYALFYHNLGWLGLSLLVELAVAGVGLWFLARTELNQWLGRLLVVLLANLATLPVVWLTFPAFGQFQSIGSRLLGVITLVVVAFYVVFLLVIYRTPRKVRLWAIPVTVLTFLVVSAACLIMLALNYYGAMSIYTQGLPPTLVIVLSEAFAVVAEAVLVGVLIRQSLSTWWLWTISLVMNAASFVAGWLLVGK